MTSPAAAPRLLDALLRRALRSSPVVVLTGARQTGKSTLARALCSDGRRKYLTLDDLETLDRARRDPETLVSGPHPIVLDEVQRAPDLLVAVKRAVDERRTPGRFLLTGSADLLLMERVSESLAGRAAHLTLWPTTRRERLGRARAGLWTELLETRDEDWPDLLAADDAGPADWRSEARAGGYPTSSLHLDDADERSLWFAGYERTYLERDLRELSAVASLVDFRRLMRAACLRIGNLVNQTDLARDVGISQPTAHRHLALLELSYQLVRLAAYAPNRTKRLIKSPKAYWSDTGLAMHLSGEDEPRGAHLENVVLSDLLAWQGGQTRRPEVLFWRAADGHEVDFVIEHRGRLLPIEVKASSRARAADAEGLTTFRSEYGEASRAGLLLHTGDEIDWVAKGVLAAPWWRVV